MIIGINGRIGSGKDTVGRIIQYLIYFDKTKIQPSLGITKHIAQELLKPSYLYYETSVITKTDWEDKKFAGKLKEIASLLTGIAVEKFEDQEFKKQEMPKCWNKLQQSGRSKVSIPMTYRDFLQKLGTEAMRDGLHTNVWVNALMSRYPYNSIINEINSKTDGSYGVKQPNWIITDMRFPNEMDAVKERKGITIRVSRTGIHTPKAEDLHPSETSLDDAEFDYHIDNSGTIEDLIEKVKEILIKENII